MFQTFCLWLSFVLDFTGGISVCRSPPHNVAGSTPLYFLSVAVVLRDEENFVEEWARHYLAEGVEHIYMLDQASIVAGGGRGQQHGTTGRKNIGGQSHASPRRIQTLGGSARVLREMLPSNVTTFVVPPPLAPQVESRHASDFARKNKLTGHLSVANMPNMAPSYRALTEAAKGKTSWLIIVDSDEYMFATGEETISDVLWRFQQQHPNAGQISVPWQIFGSSRHIRQPACVVSAFTWRWTYPPFTHRNASMKLTKHGNAIALVKSIVRLDALPWQSYRSSKPWAVHAHRPFRTSPDENSASSSGWYGCDGCLCPHWTVLNAGGSVKPEYDAKLVKERTGRTNLDRNDWTMHDWVDLQSSSLRLHHYRFRSREWMLRVKACRSLPLLGQKHYDPKTAVTLSKSLVAHVKAEDARAIVCDDTLALRRRSRPAWRYPSATIGNSQSIRCSFGDLVDSETKSTRAAEYLPRVLDSFVGIAESRTRAPSAAFVNVGSGCGLEEATQLGRQSNQDRNRRLKTYEKYDPKTIDKGLNDTDENITYFGPHRRRVTSIKSLGHKMPTESRHNNKKTFGQWVWPSCSKANRDGNVIPPRQ